MPALALLLILVAAPAWAHGGEAPGVPLPWTFDPWIVCPLAALGIAYGLGMLQLAGRAAGTLLFAAGWLSLAGALVSPLHWLGEHLFSFHMIEHEIVMAVAAPLLVLARPAGVLLWALPKRTRLAVGSAMRYPATVAFWQSLSRPRNATILHGIAIWLWHVPIFFDAAVADVSLHRLQHVSFLATALLFWWAIVRRANAGTAFWHLFVTMIHTSVLGALMALAPRVLYGIQTAHSGDWGLTPLEDQQLAGIIMWVPAGTVYAGAALAFAARWIRRSAPVST